MSDTVLEVKHLSKEFQGKSGMIHAVNDINFKVKKGEIFGFLGANGAGKSTTIKMVTSQLLPTGGTILYDGEDLTRDTISVRKKIGVVANVIKLI